MRFLSGVRLCAPADQFTTRATCYRRACQGVGSLPPHLAFLLRGTGGPSVPCRRRGERRRGAALRWRFLAAVTIGQRPRLNQSASNRGAFHYDLEEDSWRDFRQRKHVAVPLYLLIRVLSSSLETMMIHDYD